VYFNALQQAAQAVDKGTMTTDSFKRQFADYEAWSTREIVGLDASEAIMTKRLGDELSMVVPDRNQLYAAALQAHENEVRTKLATKSGSDVYGMLVAGGWRYGSWTFEFGEYRESRLGKPEIVEGEISVPYSVSVVGRVTERNEVFNLTLYFTVSPNGSLRLIGIR
jgi:hypothetical protein